MEVRGGVASEINHNFLKHYSRIERSDGECRVAGDIACHVEVDGLFHHAASDCGVKHVIDIFGSLVKIAVEVYDTPSNPTV